MNFIIFDTKNIWSMLDEHVHDFLNAWNWIRKSQIHLQENFFQEKSAAMGHA